MGVAIESTESGAEETGDEFRQNLQKEIDFFLGILKKGIDFHAENYEVGDEYPIVGGEVIAMNRLLIDAHGIIMGLEQRIEDLEKLTMILADKVIES